MLSTPYWALLDVSAPVCMAWALVVGGTGWHPPQEMVAPHVALFPLWQEMLEQVPPAVATNVVAGL
jgi:hypothetical protein